MAEKSELAGQAAPYPALPAGSQPPPAYHQPGIADSLW